MWIYTPNIDRTIQVKNPEFEFFHFVSDGWRSEYGDILFEAKGAFWLAGNFDNDYMQFSNGVYVNSFGSKPLVKVGNDWVYYAKHKQAQWVVDGARTFTANYKADLTTDTLIPYNVRTGSPSNSIAFTRQGITLATSSTLLGQYSNGAIIGWRHYQHDELDDENNPTGNLIDVYQSVELTDPNDDEIWSYTYKGRLYEYYNELPLSNFEMIGSQNNLQMYYVDLVSLSKTVTMFDGGAQNVD